jgi:hypothetical protein
MKIPRRFEIKSEDLQCPDCKIGLIPSDNQYFFCCSCGIMIEKKTGLEVLSDY